jgi:hypothetical protein
MKRTNSDFELETSQYAILAQAAYDKERKHFDFADYLADDSTAETAVYKSKKNGKIIASSRGTTLGQGIGTAAKDLGSDALLGLGMTHLTDREKDLEKHVSKLQKKYGKNNIELTGHSLGGRLADDVARGKGLRSQVFNKGTSPLDLVKKHKQKGNSKKNVHHHTKGDVISAFDTSAKRYKKSKRSKSAHTIEQFTEGPKKTKGKKKAPKKKSTSPVAQPKKKYNPRGPKKSALGKK